MGRDELVGIDVGLGHYPVKDVVCQKHAEQIEWSGIAAGIVASRCVRVWRQVASFSYVTFTTDLQSITILSFALLLSIITLSLSPLLLLTVWLSNISLKLIFTPVLSRLKSLSLDPEAFVEVTLDCACSGLERGRS